MQLRFPFILGTSLELPCRPSYDTGRLACVDDVFLKLKQSQNWIMTASYEHSLKTGSRVRKTLFKRGKNITEVRGMYTILSPIVM